MRTLLIFLLIAFVWFFPSKAHHDDIVRACKEKGYVSGAPFGEDIKCEEMKVKND